MRRWLAGLMLCAASFACAPVRTIDTVGPDFAGRTTIRQRGNLLPTPAGAIAVIEINLERVETMDEAPPGYAILLEVHSDEFRIRRDEPLRLIMAGDTVVLPHDSVMAAWPRLDPTVREQARYPAGDSVLVRLAGAEEVRVRVRGAAWIEERRLSEANLASIREFVGRYVSVAD